MPRRSQWLVFADRGFKARSHSALRERRYAPLAARSAATRLFICGWTRLYTAKRTPSSID